MTDSTEEQRAEELRQLIEARLPDYEVSKHWNIDDGWHFAMVKDADRLLMVVRREVLNDWTAKQILSKLDSANWLVLIGSNKSKRVPHFTNLGVEFSPWPE